MLLQRRWSGQAPGWRGDLGESIGRSGHFPESPVEPAPGSRHVSVIATQGDLPGGVQVRSQVAGQAFIYQGRQPDFVTMYHELVGGTLKYRAGQSQLRSDSATDNQTVIKIENEIRQFHGMSPRTGTDHGLPTIAVRGKQP